jgi:hypothetical protein
MPKDARNTKTSQHPSRTQTTPSPYVRSVLQLYTELPSTPHQPTADDRFVAQKLQLQRIPFRRVHAALLLGSARRLFRADPTEPLLPIRSIRYFLPVVDELAFAHLDSAYVDYLRQKLSEFLGRQLIPKSASRGDWDSAGNAHVTGHLET